MTQRLRISSESMATNTAAVLALLASIAGVIHGLPRTSFDDKGFSPLSNYIQMKDQVAMESSSSNETLLSAASDKAGRFGFPTYQSDVQNGNGIVPGVYGPVKLDIGGLVLGTIVGLGAFFILPKILHVFSGPYGGYKRSEDDNHVGGINLEEITRRVSDSFEAMNLDATACIQRAMCSTMQTPSISDGIVKSITKNDMVKTFVAGTDWEKAVVAGDAGESCGAAFPKCPFTIDSVVKPLVKYLSAT